MVNSKIYDCQRGVDRNKALKQSSLEKKRKQRKAVSQFCFLKFWKTFTKLRILKTFSCVLSRTAISWSNEKKTFSSTKQKERGLCSPDKACHNFRLQGKGNKQLRWQTRWWWMLSSERNKRWRIQFVTSVEQRKNLSPHPNPRSSTSWTL